MSVFFPCYGQKEKVVVRNRRGSSVVNVRNIETPYGEKTTVEDVELRNRIYSTVLNLPYGASQTNYVDVNVINDSQNIHKGKRVLYLTPAFEMVIE